ncbi:MAG: hypothetical protein F6K10_15190 [Moorea sp. SIO2B7]|nr:hypothetical protein [Moorena sp. SIO2B7]
MLIYSHKPPTLNVRLFSSIETFLKIKPAIIVYISCKPATLARDLKLFCQTGIYKLTCIQPADLFPQTAHVECAAFLQR